MDIRTYAAMRSGDDYRAMVARRRDDGRREATRSLLDDCQGECPNGHACTLSPDAGASHYLRTCDACTYAGMPVVASHVTLETVTRAAMSGASRAIVEWARATIADRTCEVCGDATGRCTFAIACSCWHGRSCARDVTVSRSRPFGYIIATVDGRYSDLVQSDREYCGIATSFGWDVSTVRVRIEFETGRRGWCSHDFTDGTIECDACGTQPADFIDSAISFLDDYSAGAIVDPGYFTMREDS